MEGIYQLKKVFEDNPKLYFKFRELVLRIKEYDGSNIEKAKVTTLNHIFKAFPFEIIDINRFDIKKLDEWFDKANHIFSEKKTYSSSFGKYKTGIVRRRGSDGGMLTCFPKYNIKEIIINSKELDLVYI